MAKFTVHEEARPQEYVLVGEFEASREELEERFSRGPRVRITPVGTPAEAPVEVAPEAPVEAPKKRRKRTPKPD